jgi:DNA polymerase (family 10)
MAQLIYKSNKEIARTLAEISFFLEMEGVDFKPKAYQKASAIISDLSEDVLDIYHQGGLKGLESIPGVGISIAEKIEEFFKSGKIKYLEDFKKKWPVKVDEFMNIEGIGPKTVRHLYEKLKVKDLDGLEKALKKNKISGLEGFGEKSQEKILKNIEFHKKAGGRAILGFIMPEIRVMKENFEKIKGVERADVAGSVARRKETIGDIDFLIISKNPKPVMDYFTIMPETDSVLAYGDTKSSVRLKNGLDADIRVIAPESYGAALMYFIGSKEHNIALREIAIKKGWKLNEYGLFKGTKMIAGKTEEEIYEKLGLKYIEPEMREMRGEIEASKNDKLPKLIGYGDLIGDLHVHSTWSDGSNSIEEMARAAIKRGLKYIAISDHSQHLAIAHGLDLARLKQQWKEIDALNKKLAKEGADLKILKGTECDVLKDGSMDFPEEILKQFDVVNASVHSSFNLSEKEQTERIKKAMRNKNVNIVCHLTGRILNQRDGYKINMDEIIKTAKETSTILEINSFPNRLDLNDEHIKKCVEEGVRMSINTDGHFADHFDYLEYGIAQARRGWAEKKDIINAWPLEKMLEFLK